MKELIVDMTSYPGVMEEWSGSQRLQESAFKCLGIDVHFYWLCYKMLSFSQRGSWTPGSCKP